MAKTSKQIEGDIYQLLKDSTLYSLINGEVYRKGYRPRDSKKEDAVVIFTTGLAGQMQSGVVTINLFVPDINISADGVFVEDGKRTEELERLAQQWFDSLSCEVSCYRFELMQTIYTEEEPSIHQHFIVIKLRYDFFGDDYAPLNLPQQAMIDASDTDTDKGYFPLLETEDGRMAVVTPTRKNQSKK